MPSPSTAIATHEEEPTSPLALVTERLKAEGGALHAFLPSDEHRQRFLRIVLKAIQDNPGLAECTPASIASAAVEAAMYGLEPSGAVGGAHLVPFRVNVGSKDSPRYEKHAQLVTDYRGDIELARRSEKVEDAYAEVVRREDSFTYDAAQATVFHKPNLAAARSPNPDDSANPVTYAYACIVHRSGYRRFVVMSKAEIEAIRAAAPAANGPAWRGHWIEMAKKTALKRGLKTAPLPPALKAIIGREDELFGQPFPTARAREEPRGQALASRLAERRQPQLEGGIQQPGQDSEASSGTAAPQQGVGTPVPVDPPEPADEARGGEGPGAPDQPEGAAAAPPATEPADGDSRSPASPAQSAGPSKGSARGGRSRHAPSASSPLAARITQARAEYGFEPEQLRHAVASHFDGLTLDDLSDDEWDTFTRMAHDYAVLPAVGTDAYRALPVGRKSKIRALTEQRDHDQQVQASSQALAATARGEG